MSQQNAFRGEQVRLRAIRADDWERFHEDAEDTESARLSHQIELPRSPEAARKWAEEAAVESGDDRRKLAIENAEGDLVGSIVVYEADRRHGTFRFGLGIFRPCRRRGYASEAILLLQGFYFKELRYQKATVGIYAFNEPSIKLFEKLGFRQEGRIRRSYHSQGAYHDELIYGRTVDEFREEMAGRSPAQT